MNLNYITAFQGIFGLVILIIFILGIIYAYIKLDKKQVADRECEDLDYIYDRHSKRVRIVLFIMVGVLALIATNFVAIHLCKTEKV